MSTPIHLISSPIVPGYGVPSDSRCSSTLSSSIRTDYSIFSQLKNISMTCSSRSSFLINCSRSEKYERDPDYFYRPEEYKNVQSYEYKSKYFDPKIGYSKFQSKSIGENDKEVIELFQKVKAQLREKAMSKKKGNIKDSSRRPKKNISSLVEVLEKHSNLATDRSEHMKVSKREPFSTSVAQVNQTVDSKEKEIEAESILLDKTVFEEIFDDETCENDGGDDNDGKDENSNETMAMVGERFQHDEYK